MRTMVERLSLTEPSKLWVDLTPKVGFNRIELHTMLTNMTRVLSKEKKRSLYYMKTSERFRVNKS